MFFKKNKGKVEKIEKKTEKQKAQYVKICPRCRSINVKISNQGGSAGIIFGAPTLYRCQSCGYSNYAFPEVDLNELKKQKAREHEREHKNV